MGSPKGWNIIKKGSRADYQRSHHTLIDSLTKRQSSIVDCIQYSSMVQNILLLLDN